MSEVSLGAVAHGGPAVGTTYADIGGRLPMQKLCERGTYADMGGHLAMQKICERGTYANSVFSHLAKWIPTPRNIIRTTPAPP